MKKKKQSIQEIILNALIRKKAIRHSDINDHVELIQNTDSEEGNSKIKYAINRAIKNMINDEVIESHETEQSSFLSLTNTGRQKLRSIKLSSQNHLVTTQWDGYWRIVIVDIPDSRKKDQDALRYILKKAQFVQLKSSLWISPYPLEHMLINMKADMGLHEELIILVSDKIDTETENLLQSKFMEK